MNAADILKALWQQKKIVALFLAAALLLCHLGLFVCQTHTATAYVKYMEDKAEDGVATNGSKLDPYEITEPFIVSKALAQMGSDGADLTAITQRILVTPVISSAEQEKYASWIEEFSDYENTEEGKAAPVYYRVEFQSKEGLQFAQAFLNALIHQYRSYYTERYTGFCEVALVPQSTVLNADYYYSVEMLEKQVQTVKAYLSNITSGDVDYRSPKTGYSLDDLAAEFDLFMETEIAPLTQYVLDNGISKDVSTLLAALRQRADDAQLDSDASSQQASSQKQMMQLYAEKNRDYVSSVLESKDYDTQIREDVERDRAYSRALTTYDQMMLTYVDYAVKSSERLLDKTYINANLSKFGNSAMTVGVPYSQISDLYDRYAELVDITNQTLAGYNELKCGRSLLQVSGIMAEDTMPELVYYTVSLILAVCLGCGYVVLVALNQLKEKEAVQENEKENLADGVL